MLRAFWVVKVAAQQAGRNDSFDDPKVQAFIQLTLIEQLIEAENNRLILKNEKSFRLIRPRRISR